MPTLADLTGCARGVILWEDGTCALLTDWRAVVGSADLLRKAQRITKQELLPSVQRRLEQEGNGACIVGLWRIGGKIVAPLAEND